MVKTIVALDRDGFDINILVMNFEVPSPDFDLSAAVRAAVKDFCATENGKAAYECQHRNFNWGDFAAHVTNEFCIPHGFSLIDDFYTQSPVVDFNEQLIDECDVFPDDEDSE